MVNRCLFTRSYGATLLILILFSSHLIQYSISPFLVLLHHVSCFVLGRCTKSFSRKQHPAAAENRAMRVVRVIPNVVVTVFTLHLADTGLRKRGYVGNTQNTLRLGLSASNTKYVIGCSYFTAWHWKKALRTLIPTVRLKYGIVNHHLFNQLDSRKGHMWSKTSNQDLVYWHFVHSNLWLINKIRCLPVR